MELNKLNLLNKISIRKKCKKTDRLSKLMLLSIKFKNKPFYILDDDRYLGCISISNLIDLDLALIMNDPSIDDILQQRTQSLLLAY